MREWPITFHVITFHAESFPNPALLLYPGQSHWQAGGFAIVLSETPCYNHNEMDQLGLYIHIPFCQAKCAYCDFTSYAGLNSLFPSYVAALEAEMAWYAGAGVPGIDTLYIGGGTPTILPIPLLKQMLEGVKRHFHLSPQAEITMEANPGTVDEGKLQMFQAAGVTRFSLGVQSFRDEELALLGRFHTAAGALAGYWQARAAGFTNINLDLIYGLPVQRLSGWQATLEQALALKPDHLSCYALTLEEGTPLADRVAAGDLPAPDDDLAAEMYELAEERLGQRGYHHYEISNWARSPAYISRHNLRYWRYEPYLGLGAAAHSFRHVHRWWNVSHPERYIARLKGARRRPSSWESPARAGGEVISRDLAMAEMVMLGLRLVEEGVELSDFAQRFNQPLEEVYGAEIEALVQIGLLEITPDCLRLTPRGRLLGNEVFQRFLPPS